MAMEASRKIVEEDKDERAADAYIRYESKLDAYKFIQGKFANYKAGKGFHELPDNLLGGEKITKNGKEKESKKRVLIEIETRRHYQSSC